MKRLNMKKCIAGATVAAVAIASSVGYSNVPVKKAQTHDMAYLATEEENVVETYEISEAELIDSLSDGALVEEKDVDKDETVYVFAGADGKVDHVLVNEVLKNKDGAATLTDKTNLTDITNIKGDEEYTLNGDEITWQANGNDITYQGTTNKALPVDVKVSYYLNGTEIAPEELAGKSGKVTIRFDYTSKEMVTVKIGDKEEQISVPFVAVTGMMLGDNFKNVTVTNGKAIEEGQTQVVIGYGMPGFMESLKLTEEDLGGKLSFPNYFEVTADVTDFSLDMTVTVLMNGSAFNLGGNVDLSSLDKTIESIGDATTQLAEGSSKLEQGLGLLLTKMGEFKAGVTKLQAGIAQLESGSADLANGVNTINASAQAINNGIANLDAGLKTPMSAEQQQAIAASASQAATTAVQAQYDNGQYAAIKQQASAGFESTITSPESVAALEAQLKPQLRDSIYVAILQASWQEACQATVAAGGSAPSYEAFVGSLSDDEKAAMYATADGKIHELAVGIASGIATNGSDAMGTQVADACQTASVQTASQVAASAAVSGAEGAKQTIAAQINATQDNGYSLVTGAQALAGGTNTLASKIPVLTGGISNLLAGSNQLVAGATQLEAGVEELADGSSQLSLGVNSFKTAAIDQLIEAYNGDVKQLLVRANAAMEASAQYETFTLLEDGAVGTTKFIIKTEGIYAE